MSYTLEEAKKMVIEVLNKSKTKEELLNNICHACCFIDHNVENGKKDNKSNLQEN